MIHETVAALTSAHIALTHPAAIVAAHSQLQSLHDALSFQPVLGDEITNGFQFVKTDGLIIGPILLAGSGVGALLLRVLHYNHAGDYIRNILIAAPIAGTLLTGGSLWLNLFGKVG